MKFNFPFKTLLVLVVLVVAATPLFSENITPRNLLENADFSAGLGAYTPGWTFSKWTLNANSPKVERAIIAGVEGAHYLRLAVPSAGKAYMWFQQEVPADGGETYRLTFKVRGNPEGLKNSIASLPCGIYYNTADKKWIGFEPSPIISFNKNWTTITFKVTAPDNACFIGVRLALNTTVACEIQYADVSLVAIE